MVEEFEDDLCVIIRSPIEEFGVGRCQQIEQELDKALAPLGFKRIGTEKAEQTYIRFRCFGVVNGNSKN